MKPAAEKWIRYGILVVSLLLIAIGIWKQEYQEVMKKAIQVCLSCIGIG